MPFIQLDSLNIHYEHQSKGDIPIILLHGNFGSWHYWQPFLQDLKFGYCAYAPDFRGCGDSQATENGYDISTLCADIIQFANRLQLDKFHLVGHSLGGAVAQQLAGTHPERILTLSLVATAPSDGLPSLTQNSYNSHLFSPQNTFKLLDAIGLKRKVLAATFRKTMPKLSAKPTLLNMVVDDALKMDMKALSGFIETLKNWRGNKLLKQFSFPVILLYGDLDSVVPLASLLRMKDQIKGCRFHTFHNVGHAPQLENAAAFNNVLMSFIEGRHADTGHTMSSQAVHWLAGLKQKISTLFKKS